MAMGALLPLLASDGGLKFGAKIGGSTPVSKEMKENVKKLNPQLGLFTTYDLGSGHGVGASLDYSAYNVKKDSDSSYSGSSYSDSGLDLGFAKRIKTVTLGANYTYHLNQKNDGAYLLAGVDVQKVSIKADTDSAVSLNVKPEHNKVFGYTVGVGYDFNENIGAQVSYNAHNYKKIDIGEGKEHYKQGVVNVGFTYKF